MGFGPTKHSWRVAMAGLGAAARQIHLPAMSRLPQLRVVGGYDPMVTADCGFPLFASLAEMLEKAAPDILVVATPPESHFDVTIQGLQAGCHVICEKPFVATREQAAAVVALSRRVGRWVVVNNQYRFMKVHRAARRRIGSPEFGELLFVNVEQTMRTTAQTEAGWRGQDPQRTCKEFGTHVFDLCRFFFGEDPEAITARLPKPGCPDGPDYLGLIRLDFAGDRVAQVTLDRLCRGPTRYLMVRLDGTRGCLETYLGGRFEVRAGIRGQARRPYAALELSLGGRAHLFDGEHARKIASDPLDLYAQATRRLLEAFLKALENGQTPPCHAEDNRRTLALMLAAYESAQLGTTIRMTY